MQVSFNGPHITLAQLLKKLDIVSSGGEVKIYLESSRVQVNGQAETRRGRKLISGDKVKIEGKNYVLKGTSDASD